jgi:hypothetical protein
MDTPQKPARIVEAFICYRRDDASFAGEWLHRLLDGHTYLDRDGQPCQLKVFYDQAEPGVANWKAHLVPALQSARALIVLCSHGLATNFSKNGVVDWAHRELDWWIDNRGTPPILLDLTGNERWIPERVRSRWPLLNRQQIDVDELRRVAPEPISALAEKVRTWVIATINESERATNREELELARKRNVQLRFATVLAVVGCTAASLQWWRADQALRVAEAQREIVRGSMTFMSQLFSRADPDGLFGESAAARQLLTAAPSTISTESSPLLKAHLLRILGSVYTGMANSGEAVDVLTKADDILKQENGEAEDQFRMAYSLGEAYLYTDDMKPARSHLERAQSLANSKGVSKSERAYASMLLGDFHAWSAPPDREKAEQHYKAALLLDSQQPPNHIAMARDYNRLGKLALDAQRAAEARANFQAAVDETRLFPPGTNPHFKAQYEHDLAAALYNDGSFASALAQFQASSESFKATYGEASIEYGVAENNVARMLLELDRVDEAKPRIARAVNVTTDAAGPGYSDLALAMNTYGLVLRSADASQEARTRFENALAIAEANEMPVAAQILVHLAELDLTAADLPSARARLDAAKAVFNDHNTTEGWRYALYENAMGELRVRTCQLEGTGKLLERSAGVLTGRWPAGNLFTRAAESRLRLLEAAESSASTCKGSSS